MLRPLTHTSLQRPAWTGLVLALVASVASAHGFPEDGGRPGVLLVSFDTTRADALGCYGAVGNPTPNVDRLAAEGVRFAQAFTPVPLTLPSHTTMLTGIDPPRHTVRDNAVYNVPERALTMAEILQQAGYRTFAEVASIVLLPRYQLNQGFASYGVGDMQLQGGAHARRTAGEVADAVLAQLDGEGPFFGFVHFYDAHLPIELPEDFAERFEDPYAGAVAFADEALGRIVAGLEERELLERTLIIVTSDHGEGRGDHEERTHGSLLYDTTQRVPLVLRHPELGRATVEDRVAKLADLLPTVLDVVGLEIPDGLDGRSLVPVIQGDDLVEGDVYLETLLPMLAYDWAPLYGVRTLEWKLVLGARPHLFQLHDDPLEEHDLAADRPEVVEKLSRRVRFLRDERGEVLDRSTRTVTGAELRVLGGLGYVGHAADESADGTDRQDPFDHAGTLTRILEAQELFDGGDLDGAIAGFEALAEEAPGTFRVLQALGACYGRKGEHGLALHAFRRAAKVRPDMLKIHLDIATAARNSGREEVLREHLTIAIAMEGCPPGAYFTLWQSLVTAGENPRARAVLEQLLERDDLSKVDREKARRSLKSTRRH